MKGIKKIVILFLIMSLSTCNVFFNTDHDNSPMGIFNSLWTSFNNMYALFDVRGVDWNEIREQYLPLISPDMSNMELFRVCSQMLNTLQDPHVSLITPFGASYELINFIPRTGDVFDLGKVRREYLTNSGNQGGDGKIWYGRIIPDKTHKNVGYIHFSDFQAGGDFSIGPNQIEDWVRDIDRIIKYFADTDFLILDVRNTHGGFGLYMEYIASRFVSGETDYLIIRTKNGPGKNDFSAPVTMTVRPAAERYLKPVVLLTNNETVSAGEWFTLALRAQRHVTHAGMNTRGSFSSRFTRTLSNGWRYTLSAQKVTDINGINYEGIGISPNREHTLDNIDTSPQRNRDNQLEYALTLY